MNCLNNVSEHKLNSFIFKFNDNNPKGRNFQYHKGNNVKKIQSISIKKCKVTNDYEKINKKDILDIKYINDDDILCSFTILMINLQDKTPFN
jgi:hypothetical protein